MDQQYKQAFKTGDFNLQLRVIGVLILEMIQTLATRGKRHLEDTAPVCAHSSATVLNCGFCHDELQVKHASPDGINHNENGL